MCNVRQLKVAYAEQATPNGDRYPGVSLHPTGKGGGIGGGDGDGGGEGGGWGLGDVGGGAGGLGGFGGGDSSRGQVHPVQSQRYAVVRTLHVKPEPT